MTDPLVSRLTEVLCAAQRRYRTRRGWGALTSLPIPDGLIDEIAAGVAPVLRDLVETAVALRLDAPGVHQLDTVLAEVGLKPVDLRPGKEAL